MTFSFAGIARETDSKEASTRYTGAIHIEDLKRLIRSRQSVQAITAKTLYAYGDAGRAGRSAL